MAARCELCNRYEGGGVAEGGGRAQMIRSGSRANETPRRSQSQLPFVDNFLLLIADGDNAPATASINSTALPPGYRILHTGYSIQEIKRMNRGSILGCLLFPITFALHF